MTAPSAAILRNECLANRVTYALEPNIDPTADPPQAFDFADQFRTLEGVGISAGTDPFSLK